MRHEQDFTDHAFDSNASLHTMDESLPDTMDSACPLQRFEQVESVGLMLAKDRPGLHVGASLDGLVIDPSSEIKRGGLEVKCPYSKANISVREDCKDKTFCLKYENDEMSLKENDNYFYQVQCQM